MASNKADKAAKQARLNKQAWKAHNKEKVETVKKYNLAKKYDANKRTDNGAKYIPKHGTAVFTADRHYKIVDGERVLKLTARQESERLENAIAFEVKQGIKRDSKRGKWKASKTAQDSQKSINLKYEVKAKNKQKKAGYPFEPSTNKARYYGKQGETKIIDTPIQIVESADKIYGQFSECYGGSFVRPEIVAKTDGQVITKLPAMDEKPVTVSFRKGRKTQNYSHNPLDGDKHKQAILKLTKATKRDSKASRKRMEQKRADDLKEIEAKMAWRKY